MIETGWGGMRHGPCLSEADSVRLIEDINRWCRRTGTNYNKLVVAARVGPSLRSMVLKQGRRVSVRTAKKLHAAMRKNPAGISLVQHKLRMAAAERGYYERSEERKLIANDELESRRVNREPCPYCGIRADIGCRHVLSASMAGYR